MFYTVFKGRAKLFLEVVHVSLRLTVRYVESFRQSHGVWIVHIGDLFMKPLYSDIGGIGRAVFHDLRQFLSFILYRVVSGIWLCGYAFKREVTAERITQKIYGICKIAFIKHLVSRGEYIHYNATRKQTDGQ